MRLRRLDLTRYGKFTDYTIDFGEHRAGAPDFHIVYGLNEAGKSTSLAAYLDLLFGIEERTRYGFLHQGRAMEIGACLEFAGQTHEFKRVKQRSNSLLNTQGQVVNEAILSAPLAGLTREAYRMMFSLDDQTLEDGGNAILESKGDLGELLFSASAGLAGISSILETASDEADGIFRRRASSTRMAALKRDIADLRSRRDAVDVQASAYKTLTAALQQASAAYDEVMRDIGAAKARQNEITRILRAWPLAADYRRVQAELAAYEDWPQPPSGWLSSVSELIEGETRLETRLAGIAQREDNIRDDLEELVVDTRLLEIDERLDQLSEAAARYTTAERDLPRRRSSLSDWTRKVDLILATLGQSEVEDPRTLLVPAATIGALRDLIVDKSGVDVALQAAEKEREVARETLEKAEVAQGALDAQGQAIDARKVAHLQAILNRLRHGDLVASHRLAMRTLRAKQQAFDDAVVSLHPWTGDGEALRKISPPATGRLDHWKSVLTSLDKQRSQYVERQAELSTARDEDFARLTALRETAGFIDDEQANAATIERDEAWARHLAMMDMETAHRFEDKMRRTDAVAAARLQSAREIEELRSLTAALAVSNASLDRQSALLRGIDDAGEELRTEIMAETPQEVGLTATAPIAAWLARIEQWIDDRKSVLTAWQYLQQARCDVEAARSALALEQDALADALTAIGLASDGVSLDALMLVADAALADNAALQSRRTEASNRVNELKAALEKREKTFNSASAVSDKWQAAWSHILSGTWFADRHSSVGAVKEMIDAVANLPEALRELNDLEHRIDSMETDRQVFARAVAELHVVVDDPFDGTDPLAAAKALIARHEDAKLVQSKRKEREQALIDLAEDREKLTDEAALHAVRKREMTDFFGVETLAEVRQALERCRERNQLRERQATIERQIVVEMQQPSIGEAIEALEDIDLTALQREEPEVAARLNDLDSRSKELFADVARVSDQLNAIGGDDAVARIEANRRTVLLEMEDLAVRYLRLKTGKLVADHALRAYRDKHRSAMMDRASEAFRVITRDEYSGLATTPEKDREVLIGLSRSGGSKLAVDMSKGTRFQLYLALRLAGYEEFAAARPSVPLIADDIMETFDEPRSEEVFRLFGRVAQLGQVIYLTHHRHLCEIAKQVIPSVRIHELSTPDIGQ